MSRLFFVFIFFSFCLSARAAENIPDDLILRQKTSGGLVTVNKELIRQPSRENKKYYDETYARADAFDFEYPFDVVLSKKDARTFSVICTGGMSADPSCIISDDIHRYGNNASPLTVEGESPTMPGDGCIYFNARSNENFRRYDRYCLEEKSFVKTEQPFYAVNLDSVAQNDLQLFADAKLTKPLFMIRKGEKVKVIIALPKTWSSEYGAEQDPEIYLLEDAHGITGWANAKANQSDDGDIKGLQYYGD